MISVWLKVEYLARRYGLSKKQARRLIARFGTSLVKLERAARKFASA
jgi:hypothetical protein